MAFNSNKSSAKFTQLRRTSAILHDLLAAIFAWLLAFSLRFNFQIPTDFYTSIINNGMWVIPIQLIMFFQFGLYRGVWRFASLPDLKRIINAVIVAGLIVVAIKMLLLPKGVIPRSVHLLDPILLIMMMGGSRFIYRAWKDHHLYALTSAMGKPVLVVGAGELAINLLNDLARSQEWRVVGVLDDEAHLHGRDIRGVRVLGGVSDLSRHAEVGVENIILALDQHQQKQKKRVIDLASELGLNVLTVPSLDDLISGKLNVSQIRKVDVEDLLGREPVALDLEGLESLLYHQSVLVSGAGGSIGSEMCRQIIKFKPSVLICLDISEFFLYQLEQEFAKLNLAIHIHYVIADVKNTQRLQTVMTKYNPSIVFHAAAYKHVPMMEHENVVESLNNNVQGTYQIAHMSKQHHVKKFVLISTDKAVNPTNVMGASKRLAEMVCQGLQDSSSNGTGGTQFVIVRFGNVLGSSGSVIPKFREQIAAGGPITVTHPEITRYFMSIPEACQLVMQAGLMGSGGEIFVMDMGDPVKIADLARDMIHLSGLSEEEIEIKFTGLRPGEKLYEELLADDENTIITPHEKLRIALARNADIAWVNALLAWLNTLHDKSETKIKDELKLWAEEYQGDVNAGQPQLKSKAKNVVYTSTTLH